MNSLNQIILEGNIVRNPLAKLTPNGKTVCTLPIAVNYKYKNSDGNITEEVSYFDVETFGKLAENCSKWCPTGRGIRVVGRIKQNRWKDTEGKSHSKVHIVAEHVEFLKLPKRHTSELLNGQAGTKEDMNAIKAATMAAAEQENNDTTVF